MTTKGTDTGGTSLAMITNGAAGGMRLHLESVPWGITRVDLRAAFEAFGTASLVLIRSGRNGCSKATVRFQEVAAAEAAVRAERAMAVGRFSLKDQIAGEDTKGETSLLHVVPNTTGKDVDWPLDLSSKALPGADAPKVTRPSTR